MVTWRQRKSLSLNCLGGLAKRQGKERVFKAFFAPFYHVKLIKKRR